MNKIGILFIFSCYMIAQVSPFGSPENILSKEVVSINLINPFSFNFADIAIFIGAFGLIFYNKKEIASGE